MLPEIRTAFFIGSPDQQEQILLASLEATHRIYMLDCPGSAYQYMARMLPEVVIFSSRQADTETLKFFRQLRRIGRVSTVVCTERELQGFAGKKYRRQRSIQKDPSGLATLIKWLVLINTVEKFDRQTAHYPFTVNTG
jgi:hypothetical protein